MNYTFDTLSFTYLKTLLNDHNHLNSLTWHSSLVRPEITHEIQKLRYLYELLIVMKDHIEFPILELPCLEIITIININAYDIYQLRNITKNKALKYFYIMTKKLSSSTVNTLEKIKLNAMVLSQIETIEPGTPLDKLFDKKSEISLLNCCQTLITALTKNCGPDTNIIVIANKIPNLDWDLEPLAELPNIKEFKLRLTINSIKQYFNILRMMKAIRINLNCKWFIHLILTQIQPFYVGTVKISSTADLHRYSAMIMQNSKEINKNLTYTISFNQN